jgi:hypothetical protein
MIAAQSKAASPAKSSAAAKRTTAIKSASPFKAGHRALPARHTPPVRSAATPGGKRNAQQLQRLMDSALKYIRRHPGARMDQIGAAMRVASKQLTLPLQRLKAEGHLKVKGQKRATSYFAK